MLAPESGLWHASSGCSVPGAFMESPKSGLEWGVFAWGFIQELGPISPTTGNFSDLSFYLPQCSHPLCREKSREPPGSTDTTWNTELWPHLSFPEPVPQDHWIITVDSRFSLSQTLPLSCVFHKVGAQHPGLLIFPICQHILVLTIGSQGWKNLTWLHLVYWHIFWCAQQI